jgi:hypothetical protein
MLRPTTYSRALAGIVSATPKHQINTLEMKTNRLLTLLIGLTILSCNQTSQRTNSKENKVKNLTTSENLVNKEEIQNLIIQVLIWADSKKTIDLLPMITDSKDSVYIGFDLEKHEQNLQKLKETNFFATEFIDNYNQIILTLDKGIRNSEYEQWLVGHLPTFIFANGANPWCMCQDTPSDIAGNLDVIKFDNVSGELFWNWGTDSDWINFKIRVIKENNKWKIAYLQGFDFNESTRKDGQF